MTAQEVLLRFKKETKYSRFVTCVIKVMREKALRFHKETYNKSFNGMSIEDVAVDIYMKFYNYNIIDLIPEILCDGIFMDNDEFTILGNISSIRTELCSSYRHFIREKLNGNQNKRLIEDDEPEIHYYRWAGRLTQSRNGYHRLDYKWKKNAFN